jgi:hypothetical protein
MPPLIAGKRTVVVRGGYLETGPEIEFAIVDVDSVGTGGACTTSMTSAGPLASVVQVNVSILNVRPAGRTMEAWKLTIWLAMESARTPPT